MAFSQEEIELVSNAFEVNKYYAHYVPLIEFWFKTGCRPSEAIGLQ
ncbi:hypothetical protein [Hydrococcus rivularis]|nr:hypothetical protein [Hydrococcus rivularis]